MMSIWSIDGVSEFPLTQPMVGQYEFFKTFKNFLKIMKSFGKATIFPLVALWGVGKSRIGFQFTSEILGMDKGWIVNDDGETKKVRMFKPNFGDNILPLYIRYSQMCHEDLMGDDWVAFGIYTALSFLSRAPETSIQGKIVNELQNNLRPMGFSEDKLKEILQVNKLNVDDLLSDSRQLDKIVRSAVDYIKKFGISHFLIICDELETKGELAKYGLDEDKELISRLDGHAINVITNAIKHEDPRKKYPEATFLLLCSTAIGDSINAIGALDRRTELYVMDMNPFSDISDFKNHLQKEKMIPEYPEGIVEAAYAISGGNFGWFNVIMAQIDLILEDEPGKEVGEIFLKALEVSSRFQDRLIDISAFDYINCEEMHKPLVKSLILRQLPAEKEELPEDKLSILLNLRAEDGGILFKEFYCIKLSKDGIGRYLNGCGFKRETGDLFFTDTGIKFDLDKLLKSLKTFSVNVKQNEYLIGKDEETFLDQIRMVYPVEDIEDSGKYIFQFIQEEVTTQDIQDADFVGPSFAYLAKIDKRYQAVDEEWGFVNNREKNKTIEKQLKDIKKNKKDEVKRILQGAARVLEIKYPETEASNFEGVEYIQTNVEEFSFLEVHPDRLVSILWGKDEEKVARFFNKRPFKEGVHPIFIISDTLISESFINKLKKDYPNIGKCIIQLNITRFHKDILEAIALPKTDLDIRESAGELTSKFREKIRRLRDRFYVESKKWFKEADENGWVLRPIIYKKSWKKNEICILAEAFKKMLLFGASFSEIGTGVDNKKRLKEADYEDLKLIIKRCLPGKVNQDKYGQTGLFLKATDTYDISIPSCMPRMISFFGIGRKSKKDFLKGFFFSAIKEIKPAKIFEQWNLFLSNLSLMRNDEGFLDILRKENLQDKYTLASSWLMNDCKNEIKELKKIIDGPYLTILNNQIPKYEHNLKQANSIKDGVNLALLKKNENRKKNWQKSLKNIDDFYELCQAIYDPDQWKQSNYNANIIKTLKIDDASLPLWYRIKHIKLFIEYIKKLKDPASEKLKNKIDEVKKSADYKGHQLPVSPVTNILNIYCNELEFATDSEKTKSLPTMSGFINTIVYKLLDGKYAEAVERLDTILGACGLELKEDDIIQWVESGINGKYSIILNSFKNIVKRYESLSGPECWIDYFKTAPEPIQKIQDISKLKDLITKVKTFVDVGLQQEIEDKEDELSGKHGEYLNFLETTLNEMESYAGQIEGYEKNTKNIAIKERNKLLVEPLIETLNKIRKNQKKDPFVYDKSKSVEGNDYEATKQLVNQFMDELKNEGINFFKNSEYAKKTSFDFFMEVVKKSGEINWSESSDERCELEQMNLIQTKVVLI